MIGFLDGVIALKQPPMILLNVNGIGYEVESPMTVFYDLPAVGEKILLHTHLQVREDAHKLYGFLSMFDRDMFRTLLKVSGVGPKVALAILSGLTARDFQQCVADGDIALLTRVPGIGKKTAERLLIEMRDRVDIEASDGVITESGVSGGNPIQDAISALVALGYKTNDASRAVRSANEPNATGEELIRAALKSLSRGLN